MRYAIIVIALLSLSGFRPKDEGKLHVVYFLSPTCKICQYYSLEMRAIYEEFAPYGITFSGSVPGKQFDSEDVRAFKNTYQLPFDIYNDTLLHRSLEATITPEVYILTSTNEVVYHGRIDDSYVSVGKRRAHVKHHELREVLNAYIHQQAYPVSYEPAVGCFIEK